MPETPPDAQPELLPVPTPSASEPGWCRVTTRYGAARPCGRRAEGLAAEWTAPLDPARRLASCRDCADAYRLPFVAFES